MSAPLTTEQLDIVERLMEAKTEGLLGYKAAILGQLLGEAAEEIQRQRAALEDIASGELGVNLCIRAAQKALANS